MAYRRSLSIRVNNITKRFNPCLGYITHDDERKIRPTTADSCRPRSNSFLYRGYHNYNINKATAGLSTLFRDSGVPTFSMSMGLGSSVCCYSSTTAEEGSDKVESLSDVAGTIMDNSVDLAVSQASVVSEVATAAADSFYPIAALQYFIDGVHSFTGLNWCGPFLSCLPLSSSYPPKCTSLEPLYLCLVDDCTMSSNVNKEKILP